MIFFKLTRFIKRDFISDRSYKLDFILGIIGSLFPIVSYYFIGHLTENNSNSLAKYGGNYFSFALIGTAFSGYFAMAMGTFSGSIRRSQMAGCLEAILSSQTSPRDVVLMSSAYSYIKSGIVLCITLSAGLLFGIDYSNINIIASLLSFLLSITTFISIGIFSAAGTMLFKQGDPIQFIYGGLSSIIGGVVFLIAILPVWLQYVSYVLPIRYSLEALRLSILEGYSIYMIKDQLLILLIFTLIFSPLSIATFNWAVEKGKKDGTLMQY